ncbi:UDP-N-acetylglucosamine--N-acetylmuramyl-(pentapeptide) pyrophosphoryl-undecaprenol N-acetylglucosamine transferase MurG [Poriferisphaera corsica]|uniref:UDP-N-acetylglucosamine--N-acetylmuramyl-(pentapeptide) pyrophosphoryl-undecaprenol N-acetylglucosamine transferase n=1 Tax=Poriferisphaera corsica TaxID=2528020 RepID=A0A517YR07_9BACT|nr:UDP-N-acetylglucosamine--N-acetylmuramyl-(pentapeptide) pyrophosphoryl-undecaprenol N-acetylglucosamine transferase [Poriferisphaera corsica]QDU32666.1 UDP-N-acetylglucosamine--N-acetylmuramyl-(pentapeptide) pyrophosphoryl-undecaprenol N-acetylglucosamine transferase MurG [Poriferisphaera corsica]
MAKRTIIFAGGGSGGHIFPNIAINEQLIDLAPDSAIHYLLSNRPIDADIAAKNDLPYTALPAVPFNIRPRKFLNFYKNYKASQQHVISLFRQLNPTALVATGGFVSAPAVKAAKTLNIPIALVNLDAIPGKANRFAAKDATETFSVYPTGHLPRAKQIGLPLRQSARIQKEQDLARLDLHLDPGKPTLLIFAGSQGGQTLNKMMIEFASRTNARNLLTDWQILHITGQADYESVKNVYTQLKIPARVEPFCNQMHLVWAAATLAICRSGAGSVAEVWANAIPTIFLPYPFHKDNHQQANVEPLAATGGALVLKDLIEPHLNASQLIGALKALVTNEARREKMIASLKNTIPVDGAAEVARWLLTA